MNPEINLQKELPEFLQAQKNMVPFAIATASAIGNIRFIWLMHHHTGFQQNTLYVSTEPF